jgi:hypothetical protein
MSEKEREVNVRNVPGFLSVAYSANGLKTNQE